MTEPKLRGRGRGEGAQKAACCLLVIVVTVGQHPGSDADDRGGGEVVGDVADGRPRAGSR
jgi:hypothetical protein